LSRRKRELQKRFIVFCEGDTEYNYIDKMRKKQGVEIALKPINMHGGGYSNFLKKIKMESQTNCLAKFIIIDADRIIKDSGEKESFKRLLEYCALQNEKGVTPHFLIVNNPDFEYAACLHIPEYNGQDITLFIEKVMKFGSLERFKSTVDVYEYLNTNGKSYELMVSRVKGKNKLVSNEYYVRKKNFDIAIRQTKVDWDSLSGKNSNMEEFFDVIDW
jgi:hypothetical protein